MRKLYHKFLDTLLANPIWIMGTLIAVSIYYTHVIWNEMAIQYLMFMHLIWLIWMMYRWSVDTFFLYGRAISNHERSQKPQRLNSGCRMNEKLIRNYVHIVQETNDTFSWSRIMFYKKLWISKHDWVHSLKNTQAIADEDELLLFCN